MIDTKDKHKNTCIVFVCNKAYFDKFNYTCNQLVFNGKYDGPICLVIGDDLYNDPLLVSPLIHDNNIIVKYFPTITFSDAFLEINTKIVSDGRNITKPFQWHKLHLFSTFFKQWEYIFYLDCGMTIYRDISPILDEVTEHTLLAHSDAYPTYEWKLHTQFCKRNEGIYRKLATTYNVNIDYFQTGILLFHTEIVTDTTFSELLTLAQEYPISNTNEQGILALYFTNIKPLFKQIKTHNEYTYFYDSISRNHRNKYIMVKNC